METSISLINPMDLRDIAGPRCSRKLRGGRGLNSALALFEWWFHGVRNGDTVKKSDKPPK